MKAEEKKAIVEDIATKKKALLMMRIKLSSGESILLKEMKSTKKEIARLFTKLNSKAA